MLRVPTKGLATFKNSSTKKKREEVKERREDPVTEGCIPAELVSAALRARKGTDSWNHGSP